MGMREAGEDGALALETLSPRVPEQRYAQNLDRGAALEPAIAPLRQPNAAHSTFAD